MHKARPPREGHTINSSSDGQRRHLCVEGKLVEFEVLEEAAFDASSLVDRRLAFRVKHQRLPYRLLRFPEIVFDVQFWVPELFPLDVLDVLQ